MEQISKRCPRCGESKDISAFRPEASRPRGVASYCRACEPAIRRQKYLARKTAHNAYSQAYNRRNRAKRVEWSRRHAFKARYGITPEEYDVMAPAAGRPVPHLS